MNSKKIDDIIENCVKQTGSASDSQLPSDYKKPIIDFVKQKLGSNPIELDLRSGDTHRVLYKEIEDNLVVCKYITNGTSSSIQTKENWEWELNQLDYRI